MTTPIPDQILAWAEGRPPWQRDALRRLFRVGSLTPEDLQELTQLCRRSAGLDVPDSFPSAKHLCKDDITCQTHSTTTVALTGVTNVENINALAPKLTLSFAATGLSVIYGDNGAGKSGYARILKHACRARGDAGSVLPDVFEMGQGAPKAEVTFLHGQSPHTFAWTVNAVRPEALRDISVFDTATATVYVDEKTDVAFRPFGLDVFPKLAQACDHIRSSLQGELGALGTDRSFPELIGEHAVGTTIAALDEGSAEQDLNALGTLSEAEESRLVELRRQVAALDVDAPARRAAEGKLRVARFRALLGRVDAVSRALGSERIDALAAMAARLKTATEAATRARAEAAGYSPEWTIGSAAWQELWAAAKRYSEIVLPRDGEFFDEGVDTACALCKQTLDAPGRERLRSFSAFASHEALLAETEAATALEDAIAELRTLSPSTPDDATIVEELRAVSVATADAVLAFLASADALREQIVEALNGGAALPATTLAAEASGMLSGLIGRESAHVLALAASAEPEAAQAVRDEYSALSARKQLRTLLPEVLAERTRRVRRKALMSAMKHIETVGITTKNTELTKAGISDQLRRRFQTELDRLNLRHLTVSVEPQHGAKGVTYHQVRFTTAKAQGWSASDVLSEGEQRCIALAGFLAEVSTQPSQSGVVFDDPVSSLDHERRAIVAARLVEEARARQVIVFTHDLVFLLFLEEESKRQGASWKAAFLTHRGSKRGVPVDGLPWYGQTLKQRIGWLRQQVLQLRAATESLDKEQIELQTSMLWGRLREAWECGVEEVLLGGAIRRFSRKVATQQLKKISDITDADTAAVDAGMTIASTWMPGHDLSAAINQPMPALDVLNDEVERLETWRKGIEARRK